METDVVKNTPVLVISAYEGFGSLDEELPIYIDEIREAEIGKRWQTTRVTVTRLAHDEEAELVYKNEEGAAILITRRYWFDNASGERYVKKRLVWVDY